MRGYTKRLALVIIGAGTLSLTWFKSGSAFDHGYLYALSKGNRCRFWGNLQWRPFAKRARYQNMALEANVVEQSQSKASKLIKNYFLSI